MAEAAADQTLENQSLMITKNGRELHSRRGIQKTAEESMAMASHDPEGMPGFLCMKNISSKLKRAFHRHSQTPPLLCRDPSCKKRGKCSCPPADVPQGFLAVYAGREGKRFVIPAIYLNHPAFRLLLEKSKEEFGFSQKGGLKMPFEVLLFERFLWLVGHGEPVPPELGVEELEQYYRDKYHLVMEVIHLDD